MPSQRHDDVLETVLGNGWFTEDQTHHPRQIILTLEADCNLRCAHCCWSHDTQKSSWPDWSPHIVLIEGWEHASVTYSGRIITKRAAETLRTLCDRTGKRICIVDHGYGITKFPELYPDYNNPCISIDGVAADHDEQRRMPGAAEVAWRAVTDLQTAGLDPAVVSCVTPQNIARWEQFEAVIHRENTPLSCTPIYPFGPTVDRGGTFFSPETLRAAFAVLSGGVPKHIRLYHEDHVRALLPQLQEATWQYHDRRLIGTLSNHVAVIYTPLCFARLSNRELRWDQAWSVPGVELPPNPDRWSSTIATAANRALQSERQLITQLLKGGEL